MIRTILGKDHQSLYILNQVLQMVVYVLVFEAFLCWERSIERTEIRMQHPFIYFA